MPRIARAGGVVSTLVTTVRNHLTLSLRPFERIVGFFEKRTIARGFDLSHVMLARIAGGRVWRAGAGVRPAGPVAGSRQPRLAVLLCRYGTHEVATFEPFEPVLAVRMEPAARTGYGLAWNQ